jgi:hypothetical protein
MMLRTRLLSISRVTRMFFGHSAVLAVLPGSPWWVSVPQSSLATPLMWSTGGRGRGQRPREIVKEEQGLLPTVKVCGQGLVA